jgi:hypothetical protein
VGEVVTDLLCTEGLVESGVVDYVWDRGWREPTGLSLREAQHQDFQYPNEGAKLPKRAVIACFVHYLPQVFQQIDRDGNSDGKYIIIVGPGDQSLNENGGPNCNVHGWPPFVHHIFGSAVIEKTERVTPMPMAFHAFRSGYRPLANVPPRTIPSSNRVLVSFSLDLSNVYHPGSERIQAIEHFRDKDWATVHPKLLGHSGRTEGVHPWPWEEYLGKVRQHDYLACPVGYGIERIASWEALTLGCFPINFKHPELLHFADMPMAFVDSWADVTPEWCDANRNIIDRGRDSTGAIEKLKLSYWVERIREVTL